MPFGQLASAVNALNGNLAAGWDAFTGNSGQSFSIPDGIVLDYQEVGLLGIIDYSNQANNATHYSGRGVTMDAATNTITYPTGYGSAERTATVWMRVGTLGARTLNGASGTFTFTPTATGVWEQLSSTATVSGNLSWTAGSDCDIADLQIGTAHWPHADWSDPTASGLNGKTIVDVGPDDFHGVCTGCNGFTEEGIDSEVAQIVGLDSALWFNGADTSLDYGSPLFSATADFDETFYWYIAESTAPVGANKFVVSQGTILGNFLGLSLKTDGNINFFINSGGSPINIAVTSANPYYQTLIKVRLRRVGDLFELYLNDILVDSGTQAGVTFSATNTIWGDTSFLTGNRHITGLVYGDNVTGTPSGTFLTVGQKRATIPQTGNRNWNKYQHFGGATSIVSLNSTITLTGDFSVDFAFTYDGSSAVQEYTGGLSTLQRFLYNGSNSTFFLANGVSTATFSGIVPVVGFNTINISRTGSLVTLTLNEGTDSQTFAADFVISQLGARFGNTNNVIGIITSININNQTTYTGLGNDPWADTTGSNDGTESGAFTRQLALASDANDQVDAYGTAILKPRLNNQTFNGFDDGEKWTTPDATSLDAVKTFIGFVFYDGVNDTTWLDLTAADTVIINASSGVLASSGITSPTYYTNGAAGTALNTGWNHVMVTTATAVNCGPIDGENRNGSIQFYTDVKLAAFALEEYNFNKSNYGL